MIDWNPVEIIGIRLKPLVNLYIRRLLPITYGRIRGIITDIVICFPPMVDFCGLPYIDMRVSFNSFIPAELEEDLSEKLVNY